MHRPTVGIIAIALLAIAGGMEISGAAAGGNQALQAACLRMGAIMALLWLALPELGRIRNPWLIAGIVAAAVVVLVRPKLLPWALVVLAALYFLRPRTPRAKSD